MISKHDVYAPFCEFNINVVLKVEFINAEVCN